MRRLINASLLVSILTFGGPTAVVAQLALASADFGVEVETERPASVTNEAMPPKVGVGLLFDDADVERMRANTRLPMFRDYWQEQLAIDFKSDNNFYREAFIYLITGDTQRGENAKRAVLEMAEQEYWNDYVDGPFRLGFLTTGRITTWMSLGYDWLYDLFSESERALIRNAIAEKGCVPLNRSLQGFKNPDTVIGWAFAPYGRYDPAKTGRGIDMSRWPFIIANNNFRAIINGAFALGTAVLADHDSRAADWKDMVVESIAYFNGRLEDDGSYDEGVSYLQYAMTHQVHAIEIARRKFGVDLFDGANFNGMMESVLALYLPSELYGNGSMTFGDAGRSLGSATAFWVARHSRDGLSQYIGEQFSDHDLLSVLFYDDSVVPEAPGTDADLVKLDLDWIVSRSGYLPDDYVVGMRSGGPMNHEHGDRNSIQLKAYSEILLADHQRLGYWHDDPEWEMRGARGHNTVLIDGVGHQYHNGREGTNESRSHAKIVRTGKRAGYHFWASDATQGYKLLNPDVKSVTRTILSFPDSPAIIILDKLMMHEGVAEFSARWHIENSDGKGDLDLGDQSFSIIRPGARLYTTVSGSTSHTISSDSFKSDTKEFPFRFVEVTATEKQKEALNVTVAVPLKNGEADPEVSIVQNASEWTIRISKNGQVIRAKVIDSGTLPEFEVSLN